MASKSIDKIRGALYGVAVGDALGAPLEFMSAEEIRSQYGNEPIREMLAGGWWDVAVGEVTDDTQMTLAVAWGITENPQEPIVAIGRRFISWLSTSPKDIGATCETSIRNARRLISQSQRWPDANAWKKAAKDTAVQNGKRSGGNGALMRTVYTGLYYNDMTYIRQTERIAEMTHYDDLSTQICVQYAGMVQNAIHGQLDETTTAVKNWLLKNPMKEKPTGWSKDTMNCAMRSIAHTNGFEEAVVRAVNLGGDTDTIGAVTGGLAGAMYGYDSIPTRWIINLSVVIKEQLDELAKIAFEAVGNGV